MPNHDLAIHDDGVHRAAAAGESELVHGIDPRKCLGAASAADDDVGTLSGLDAADLVLEPRRASRLDSLHLDDGGRRDRTTDARGDEIGRVPRIADEAVER